MANAQQVFHAKPMLDGLQVQVGVSGFCLDAASGTQLLVYPCYDASIANQNQVWQIRNGKLVWEGQVKSGLKGYCVDLRETSGTSLKDVPVSQQINLRTCTQKLGQRLQRRDADKDGTFLIRDADTGKCLGTGSASTAGALERVLKMTTCHGDQRWRELTDRGQVQHVSTTFCLDAGDEVMPIVYPCHEPKAQRKQRFHIVDNPGWVQLQRGWEDNGRKRYFEQCLDSAPEPAMEVALQSCAMAESSGTRWTRIGRRQPPELLLWQKASTLPPGSPQLGETEVGGRAEPP